MATASTSKVASPIDILPEELLERVLAYCVPGVRITSDSRSRAPLLVSRVWHRLGAPLFVRAVRLRTSGQARDFVTTLKSTGRGDNVRVLVADGCFDALASIPDECSNLEELGITLGGDVLRGQFAKLRNVQRLTLRKATGVYLTEPATRRSMCELAAAMSEWPKLVRHSLISTTITTLTKLLQNEVTITFRLSHSPSDDPTSRLCAAMRSAPQLHTVRTCIPAVCPLSLLVPGHDDIPISI